MHIKEIVVDGFKSYARRTVIAGFDPHFNAITGLNGSGKSNILDSICFVLGITNLSEVRAKSLTELVYKQGQAGVTKATVSIVFDNTSGTSPVGYEHCSEVTVTRQVQLGGKSKYMVNGKTTPANVVQNLFHSVQLNVNNPHFLIMQGRITKVLNMKPHEILGMVEETAGTRMYETKKLAAVKTIAKKQTKVDEINSLLNEEITPTLERLRGEKQQYLKWSKNNADVERIERFVVASEYNAANQLVTASLDELEAMQTQIDEAEELASKYTTELESKSVEISELSRKHGGEFEGSYSKAKSEEERMSKELVRVTSAWQNAQNSKNRTQSDYADAITFVNECKACVEAKENEIKDDVNGIELARSIALEAEQELVGLKEQYQNMSAGISKAQESNSEDMTLPDRISKAYNDANNADARAKQAKLKLDHLTKSIKNVEKDMKKEESSSRKLAAKRDKAKSKVDNIRAEIDSKFNSYDEEGFIALEDKKVDMENKTAELRDKVETTSAQLEGRLSFNFTDPVKGFDRTKVKGLVARLFTVQNQKHATALEVVAGKKLFQVVVDEAITAKALLNKGKLQKAVTIIPLDKITARRIPSSTAERASEIAASMNATATPAMDLISYEEEMRNAMEYVFGNTLVVDSMDAASKICDATRTRVVTLQGDVFDPSGMISGGSSGNLGTTLSKLSLLATMNQDLMSSEKMLANLRTQWNEMASVSKEFGEISDKLELATAELTAVEKHLSQTSYGMLSDKFSAMENEIKEAQEVITSMLHEKEKMLLVYNELQEKEEELKRERETRLAGIEKAIEEAKEKVTAAADSARQAESTSQTLQLELGSLKDDLLAAEEAVVAAQKAVDEAEAKEAKHQERVGETRQLYDEAKQAFIKIEEQMTEFKSALKELNCNKVLLTKKKEAAQLEAKKVSVKLAQAHKERGHAEKAVKAMVKKYPWIQSEKDAFGVTGGDYDFDKTNPVEMGNKLKALKSEQTSLAKKINKKVMGMIEKAEGEYSELLRKRKVVENDKKKIEAVIQELDVKKKAELERTWTKVNRDFGSIFSTLLPGTSAKLEPPENMNAWEGLEVKVAFGNVWKESLSELSGGQRSLLALSLILSLLLFKPAPMYILDEVDAALDLSHTQNIGNMLKSHFSQSQFIVVSLKEGMFSNANVIFRTKFTDGISTVSRTLGTGRSKPRPLTDSNAQDVDQNEVPFSKRAARVSSRSNGVEN